MAADDAEVQIDGELEAELAGCAEFVAALQDDHMMWMAYHLLIDLDWIRAGGSVKRHWSSNGHVAGFIADLRGRGETYLDIQCYADDGAPFDQGQMRGYTDVFSQWFSQHGWYPMNREPQFVIREVGPRG